MNTLSFTEENYLKGIYFISLTADENGPVSTNALAHKLDTRAATVTDMLRRLAQKELVDYQAYKGATLTALGEQKAVAVLRKHRLWETFLVEKLGFGWEEVHDIAEQLEHIKSPQLTERLSAFLGHPSYDPHGDPIPNAQGVFPSRAKLTLKEGIAGQTIVVVGVKDSSPQFLKHISKLGLGLGHQLKIEAIENFDGSVHINHYGRSLMLTAQAAANIYILEV